MKTTSLLPSMTINQLSRRVRWPMTNLLKGSRLFSQDPGLHDYRECRLCTLASLPTSAPSGSAPSWVQPRLWVSISGGLHCHPRPEPIISTFGDSRPRKVAADSQRSLVRSYSVNTGELVSRSANFCISEINIVARSSDNRWVPAGELVSANLLICSLIFVVNSIMIPVSLATFYASFRIYCFLQGFLCHLMLVKCYDFMGYSPAFVFNKIGCSSSSAVLLPWEPKVLVGTLKPQRFAKPVLTCFNEVKAPNPPPAPNLMKEDGSGSIPIWKTLNHVPAMSRPILLWFEFSGLQPPWEGLRKPKLFTGIACCPALKTIHVETVARKRYGVVVNGTYAQVHDFYALVASSPSNGLGSLNIQRRGWELDSIDVKRLKTWKAINALFTFKQCNVGLYPITELWFDLHCKALL